MPHDAFDNRLQVGDTVWLKAEVLSLGTGNEMECNGSFQISKMSDTDPSYKPLVTCSTKLCSSEDIEAKLKLWMRYASYCKSCALSGESDPCDFDTFVVRYNETFHK